MEEYNKNVDEDWKEKAKKEPAQPAGENEGLIPPEPDFNFFITTLAIQASIFLGAMPNPATNAIEKNLPQAKFIIDTLGMLKEKTKGNLSSEEEKALENILYELRSQYIDATGK